MQIYGPKEYAKKKSHNKIKHMTIIIIACSKNISHQYYIEVLLELFLSKMSMVFVFLFYLTLFYIYVYIDSSYIYISKYNHNRYACIMFKHHSKACWKLFYTIPEHITFYLNSTLCAIEFSEMNVGDILWTFFFYRYAHVLICR